MKNARLLFASPASEKPGEFERMQGINLSSKLNTVNPPGIVRQVTRSLKEIEHERSHRSVGRASSPTGDFCSKPKLQNRSRTVSGWHFLRGMDSLEVRRVTTCGSPKVTMLPTYLTLLTLPTVTQKRPNYLISVI